MLGVEPEDKFREYKQMTIIETTHGSLQLHIPSKVVKNLILRKGQKMLVSANTKTKEIIYKLVEKKE